MMYTIGAKSTMQGTRGILFLGWLGSLVLLLDVAPIHAQNYCHGTGTCSNGEIAADPSNPYQQNPHAKVRGILLYDWVESPAYHQIGRAALRRSLSRLSQQFGFRVLMSDVSGYITDATLQGIDIIVFNNASYGIDFLGGMTTPSTKAVEKFVYQQGGAVFLVHSTLEFIPCPTGGLDLGHAYCPFLARAAARLRLQFLPGLTPMQVYVDSVAAGEVPPHASLGGTVPTPTPAVINHGIRNPETRPIFSGLLRVWPNMADEWYNYPSSPRIVGDMTRRVANLDSASYVEGRVNVLLSLDETSHNVGSQRMGDHPVSWTRKMGYGLAAVSVMGHDDAYTRSRVVEGETIRDSIVEKFNWNLMRYLARDFVGCMDPESPHYNPAASVEVLTPGFDDPNPCKTPVAFRSRIGMASTPDVAVLGRIIRVSMQVEGPQSVRVTDVRGRTVHSKAVFGGEVFERSMPDPGLYIIQVTGHGGVLWSRRVVVD